jgi:methylphosphotriester-DNA--protein-cysteine methyltransferase
MLNIEQCWQAVQKRDVTYDGRCAYGAITTGAYCRPSCRTRLPLAKNVRFYETAAAARRDGLRPWQQTSIQSSSAPLRGLGELIVTAITSITEKRQARCSSVPIEPHRRRKLQRSYP